MVHIMTMTPVRKRRLTYLYDWIFIAITAGLAGGLYSRPPTHNIIFRAGPVGINNDDQFESWPIQDEIIPTWLSAVIAIGTNFIIFLIAYAFDRNKTALHHAVLGTGMALALSTLFQVTIKNIIGGTRPTFLERCRPDYSRMEGIGYGGVYFDRRICTGNPDEIDDALESFPSGHSNAAFAGMLFLSLWMNARVKLFSHQRGHGSGYKLLLVFIPIWGACILSLSRLVDHSHHWYDILAGAIIGIVFAIASYRSYFQALLDSRFNHIPLVDPDENHPGPVIEDPINRQPIQLDNIAQPVGPAAV